MQHYTKTYSFRDNILPLLRCLNPLLAHLLPAGADDLFLELVGREGQIHVHELGRTMSRI